MYQSISKASSLPPLSADERMSFCRLQLQKLVTQVSAFAGWLVYSDLMLHKQQPIVCYQQSVESCNLLQRRYLESGEFFKTMTPNLALQSITLGEHSIAYVKVLTDDLEHASDRNADYILLWCDRPLSPEQERQINSQLESLHDLLLLEKQYCYQQEQTNQLRQVLRRIEHQLRNPLAIIHLYTENLYHSLTRDTDKKQVASIREAIAHLSKHLSEVVKSSQASHLNVQVCHLKDIIEESIDGLQLLIQQKRIQVRYPNQSIQVMADSAQLKQVFDNLLHNALCFSPVDGEIDWNWQRFHQEVLITVTDQGPGLSTTDVQQMFQPYYSRRPNGTGLGLAIAQTIIAAHRGRIWANHLSSGGAQFSISLPIQSMR